ncbi:KTSC domain-containing protein [Acinetobacter schindleri]|jgi:hypothetical protein|uniref:KTSC domain-containing protein n=1 Tax=Acinetobacter schindleri TaxID=108981 RepID=UPI00289B8C94|nr:KTSC domain-containing protein [Acinetobacter schindleri]
MQRQNVKSSNLASIAYDEEAKLLEIQFYDGGVYQYQNVDGNIYYDLMRAPSHGKFFDRNIKRGRFPFKKIV